MQEPGVTSLVYLLANLLDEPPSSIEILPGEYESIGSEGSTANEIAPFLFVEKNLGIPTKVLYRCYITALAIFALAKKDAFGSTGSNVTESVARDLAASSGVILLANPAHTTALNARKRLIQRQLLDAEKELQFAAALLSSRNCANQSVLWHHRQWLLYRIYSTYNVSAYLADNSSSPKCDIVESPTSIFLPVETIKNELSIVSQACEIYPRNYFAWAHRHFCMQSIILSLNSQPYTPQLDEGAKLISNEISAMRRWIELHISDFSAVHYMTILVESIYKSRLMDKFPHGLVRADDHAIPGDKNVSLMSHAISLVQSYPNHESLWLYLRAAMCPETGMPDIHDLSHSFVYSWASQYLSFSGCDYELPTIHAYRFLALRAYRTGRLTVDNQLARRVIAANPHERPSLEAFWQTRRC